MYTYQIARQKARLSEADTCSLNKRESDDMGSTTLSSEQTTLHFEDESQPGTSLDQVWIILDCQNIGTCCHSCHGSHLLQCV